MKRILIAGANSYIGSSFEQYLSQWPDKYQVETLDMRGDNWQTASFAGYHTVFYVAGIAHINTKKLNRQAQESYWNVNAVLPVETARKAKEAGVGQFIFLSSMSVYGEVGRTNPPIVITRETQPAPRDIYGESKLAAEGALNVLKFSGFRVCILRPPMVYGTGAKGNFKALVEIARRLPIFPDISNQRSMLHVDNLCTFVKELIDLNESGLFYPQDPEYIATSQLVRALALQQSKTIRLSKILNPFVYLLMRFPGEVGLKARKAFGGLLYEQDMSRLHKK